MGELQFSLASLLLSAAAILACVTGVRCAGSQQGKKTNQLITLLMLHLCGETALGSSPSYKGHSFPAELGNERQGPDWWPPKDPWLGRLHLWQVQCVRARGSI